MTIWYEPKQCYQLDWLENISDKTYQWKQVEWYSRFLKANYYRLLLPIVYLQTRLLIWDYTEIKKSIESKFFTDCLVNKTMSHHEKTWFEWIKNCKHVFRSTLTVSEINWFFVVHRKAYHYILSYNLYLTSHKKHGSSMMGVFFTTFG